MSKSTGNVVNKGDLLPRYTFCHVVPLALRVDNLRVIKPPKPNTTKHTVGYYKHGDDTSSSDESECESVFVARSSCSNKSSAQECQPNSTSGSVCCLEQKEHSPTPAASSKTEHSPSPAASSNSGPSWSVGAAGHAVGDCRPCAWNWKVSGCSKGARCEFCHMCEEGMVKLRKKEKLAVVREGKSPKKGTPKVIVEVAVALPPGMVIQRDDEASSSPSSPSLSCSEFPPSPMGR